ncbi:penicillin-insensitive murein endopeptidase [Halopseudomonas nanhaiensis]|uniref:penicillin-insensitive murein endopeptidase n=1 Tax=Halopseudomonas nanhaiensis TaxID=2830842 RepID=UPI001CBFF110|nr:penicillin-insensitive murein endopeptidase [Halopseudomonas nanhaiensis]UAW97412.1 penicillin-insensitive murein endopeptidase [Halopseudomonas nanhaiensis]
MRYRVNPIRAALAVLSLCTLALLLMAWPQRAPADQDWSSVPGPLPGEPQIIGHHGGACLIGAMELPSEGPGYQAVDLERRRHFGHPELLDYVQTLGERFDAAGLGIMLIGDMAQPRGGPMSYGHVSHQSGLDVDVWFRLDLPQLDRSERENLEQPIVVDAETGEIDRQLWTDTHAQMIRMAADDARVSRIFVDAAIKRDLCERDWEDRAWLRRIRPWAAHDEHLHVRLKCPPGSHACVDQPEPPPGEGCDNLAPTPRTALEPSPNRTLPQACAAVLEAP